MSMSQEAHFRHSEKQKSFKFHFLIYKIRLLNYNLCKFFWAQKSIIWIQNTILFIHLHADLHAEVCHILYIYIYLCKDRLCNIRKKKKMQTRVAMQVGKDPFLFLKARHQGHRILVPVVSLCSLRIIQRFDTVILAPCSVECTVTI